MVSEVQYDVENDPRFRNNPNDPLSHLSIRKMIALYDYDPQELSPNFDTEVSYMIIFFVVEIRVKYRIDLSHHQLCVCVCVLCASTNWNKIVSFCKYEYSDQPNNNNKI